MKKWQIYTSIALNIVLIILLGLTLIPDEPEIVDLSIYTQQDLSKSLQVKNGITSSELIKIMGEPAVREFDLSREEWHYCKTGLNVDEYVVVTLTQDKVISLKNYMVSWLDVVYHHTQTPTEATIEAGGMGDCKLTAKWGSYPANTPNKSSMKDALKRAPY